MTKDEEEVMKRRGKPISSRFNVYQKTVLVAGILTLFLAIGLRPGMVPILSAGIVGGTLLLLILLKDPRPSKGETKEADPAEPLPLLEEKAVPEPFTGLKEKEILIPQDTAPSKIIESQQGPPDNHESEGRVEEEPQEEQEFAKGPQVFPENGRWADILERIVSLEEKTINLEDMLVQLEEKVADMRGNYLKSDPKIDLQTILTNLEERAEKIA